VSWASTVADIGVGACGESSEVLAMGAARTSGESEGVLSGTRGEGPSGESAALEASLGSSTANRYGGGDCSLTTSESATGAAGEGCELLDTAAGRCSGLGEAKRPRSTSGEGLRGRKGGEAGEKVCVPSHGGMGVSARQA
jgi:hypothetical protein